MALLLPTFMEPHRDKYCLAYLLLTVPDFQVVELDIARVRAPLNVLGSCEPADAFRVKLEGGGQHFNTILFYISG